MKEPNDEHLSSILNILKRWQDELIKPKLEGSDIAEYSFAVEGEELFSYVLQHCPSIEKIYMKFKWMRDEEHERQKSLMETDKEFLSEHAAGEEEIVELKGRLLGKERKLQDHLDIIVYYWEQVLPKTINASLQNSEYLKHKCDLCK